MPISGETTFAYWQVNASSVAWTRSRRSIRNLGESARERSTHVKYVSTWGKIILWSAGIVYGVLSLYLVLYGALSDIGTAFLPLGIGLMGLSFYVKANRNRPFQIGLIFLLLGMLMSLGRFGQVLF